MKNIKYICLFFLMLFSFYYTKKISDIIIDNTSLMKDIKKYSKEYEIKPINAVIQGNYIIPGLNGLMVDYKQSYYNMKNTNIFSSSKIAFKQIKPTVSVHNNKDYIIKKGITDKNSIAILYDNNKHLNKTPRLTNINDIDNICIIGKDNNCFKNAYKVAYTYKVKDYLSCKNKITAGDIIFIENDMSLDDINLLFKEIAYRDLNIDYLENVISENR